MTQGRFDAAPGLSLDLVPVAFQIGGLARRFGYGLSPVGIEELARVRVDLGREHAVSSAFVGGDGRAYGARSRQDNPRPALRDVAHSLGRLSITRRALPWLRSTPLGGATVTRAVTPTLPLM